MSDFDVARAADAMRHEFGEHAEFQAARYADLMLGYTIAETHPAPKGLPH